MKKLLPFSVLILSICLSSLSYANSFKISSPAFKNKAVIPTVYTCFGKNKVIPLRWQKVPAKAQSLVFILSDPDAPAGIWYHWLLYNLSPSAVKDENEFRKAIKMAQNGLNSWKKQNYGGPCPPSGKHRYTFHLYALDKKLSFTKPPTAKELQQAMKGHIIAKTKLMGVVSAH